MYISARSIVECSQTCYNETQGEHMKYLQGFFLILFLINYLLSAEVRFGAFDLPRWNGISLTWHRFSVSLGLLKNINLGGNKNGTIS
jgi:hypothetical protein